MENLDKKKQDESKDKDPYKLAYACSQNVKRYFVERNLAKKLDSYRIKLVGALAANDSKRVKTILLQLSSYTQVPFPFMHDIYVDYDKNINIIFDFVNNLNNFEFKNEKENEKEN